MPQTHDKPLSWYRNRISNVVERFKRGEREVRIAEVESISRERVRQIVNEQLGVEVAGQIRKTYRKERAEAAEKARFSAEMERERMVEALGHKCRVCETPIRKMHGDEPRDTCSHRCAELWPILRFRLDEELRQAHIDQNARWKKNFPRYSAERSWAERRLRGEAETYRLPERSPRVIAALKLVARLREEQKVLDRQDDAA
jgi:hypothetical protein